MLGDKHEFKLHNLKIFLAELIYCVNQRFNAFYLKAFFFNYYLHQSVNNKNKVFFFSFF